MAKYVKDRIIAHFEECAIKEQNWKRVCSLDGNGRMVRNFESELKSLKIILIGVLDFFRFFENYWAGHSVIVFFRQLCYFKICNSHIGFKFFNMIWICFISHKKAPNALNIFLHKLINYKIPDNLQLFQIHAQSSNSSATCKSVTHEWYLISIIKLGLRGKKAFFFYRSKSW